MMKARDRLSRSDRNFRVTLVRRMAVIARFVVVGMKLSVMEP